MANRHGEFIWYELMTKNSEQAKVFYEAVVGWTMGERAPGDMDYRMIAAGADFVGGLFKLTDEMCAQGAHPAWLGYVGVEDVDSTLSKLVQLGGKVLMPAWDIPEVGRIAMVADPQGAPFYIMRGAVEGGTSTSFSPSTLGHCSWNELATSDPEGALKFYGELFGWQSTEAMPMDEGRQYHFLDHNGQRIGAISPFLQEGRSPGWMYYFSVRNIDEAMANTAAGGGRVLTGPHQIPGGDYIFLGSDDEGAAFALVGARK